MGLSQGAAWLMAATMTWLDDWLLPPCCLRVVKEMSFPSAAMARRRLAFSHLFGLSPEPGQLASRCQLSRRRDSAAAASPRLSPRRRRLVPKTRPSMQTPPQPLPYRPRGRASRPVPVRWRRPICIVSRAAVGDSEASHGAHEPVRVVAHTCRTRRHAARSDEATPTGRGKSEAAGKVWDGGGGGRPRMPSQLSWPAGPPPGGPPPGGPPPGGLPGSPGPRPQPSPTN